jgi:hypothetical protein
MKRYSLLPLVAVVFAVACTDATSPANSHALLTPKNPELGILGNPPPPPVDAAIDVTISSDPFSGWFTGVYFSNGSTVESAAAAAEIGDQSLTFLGTAWLRLDNMASGLGTNASANARFKRSDDKFFGVGTLIIDGHVVVITEVTGFNANEFCDTLGESCATIQFDATVDGEAGHHGTAQAFNKAGCTLIIPGEGDSYYVCGDIIE